MIIDIHSHTWLFPQHFDDNFLAKRRAVPAKKST